VKKNRLKLKKKPIGSVRFQFYKTKTKKTELNRTQTEKNWKKMSQIRKNRAKPKKPSQNGLNRFFSKKT